MLLLLPAYIQQLCVVQILRPDHTCSTDWTATLLLFVIVCCCLLLLMLNCKTKQAPPRKRRLVTYTMQPLSEQPGHRFGVNRVLRLGEHSLLSAGRDGVVRRWDVSSMLAPAKGERGAGDEGVCAGAGQPDGVYLLLYQVVFRLSIDACARAACLLHMSNLNLPSSHRYARNVSFR